VDENEETFALKRISDKYLGDTSSRDEGELKALVEARYKAELTALRRTLPNNSQEGAWKALMWRLYPEEVADYAESDVRLTMLMEDYYAPALEAWRLDRVYGEVCDYLLIITAMERRGCLLDREFIHREVANAGPRMQESLEELEDYFGVPLNPNSYKQLQRYTGWPNTRKEFLETLIDADHVQAPIAKLVLGYRDYFKQQSSYYGKYLNMMDTTSTLRPNFQMTGTYTGRLSCWNPNLQAVPRSRDTNHVKSAFIARPGYELVEGDYSQAELRTFSHYAKERGLAAVLLGGGDLHSETAKMLGIPRFAAKRMNFSIVYGVGKDKLALMLGIPVHVAAEYLRSYHAKFPGFKRLYYEQARIAETFGYIRLGTGRVRHFNRGQDVSPAHKASSNLIQGTVAETMRVAMQRLAAATAGGDVHMLLQVHDSILFEVPQGTADRWIPVFREIMEGFTFDPGPKVDFKTGDRWGELHEWQEPVPANVTFLMDRPRTSAVM
jgi:DNA polymerase-1